MRNRNLQNRIHRAVRSVETGTPFARGRAGLELDEDDFESLLHPVQVDFLQADRNDPPIEEGISRSWRLREESLCHNADPLGNLGDRVPFENSFDDVCNARQNPETSRNAPQINRLGMRRSRRLEEDAFEWSPKETRRSANSLRLENAGEEKRGFRNFGRKPRKATRESIRSLRHNEREVQLFAGERLHRVREDRNFRRRIREQSEEAVVIHVPDHVWERWFNRHAA